MQEGLPSCGGTLENVTRLGPLVGAAFEPRQASNDEHRVDKQAYQNLPLWYGCQDGPHTHLANHGNRASMVSEGSTHMCRQLNPITPKRSIHGEEVGAVEGAMGGQKGRRSRGVKGANRFKGGGAL